MSKSVCDPARAALALGFGTIAAVARVTNPAGGFSISYQGVRPDIGEILLLSLVAPTEESLDAFLPAWEAMFESIATTE